MSAWHRGGQAIHRRTEPVPGWRSIGREFCQLALVQAGLDSEKESQIRERYKHTKVYALIGDASKTEITLPTVVEPRICSKVCTF